MSAAVFSSFLAISLHITPLDAQESGKYPLPAISGKKSGDSGPGLQKKDSPKDAQKSPKQKDSVSGTRAPLKNIGKEARDVKAKGERSVVSPERAGLAASDKAPGKAKENTADKGGNPGGKDMVPGKTKAGDSATRTPVKGTAEHTGMQKKEGAASEKNEDAGKEAPEPASKETMPVLKKAGEGDGKAAEADTIIQPEEALKQDTIKSDIRDETGPVPPEKERDAVREDTRLVEPQVILVMPDDPSLELKWGGIFRRDEIFEWGKRSDMMLQDPMGPAKSESAGFISRFGTVVPIKGLQRMRKYTLFIDFVRFSGYNGEKNPTNLKIFVTDAKSSNKYLLASLEYGSISLMKGLYLASLPFEYTVKGELELEFREYSPMSEFWGIWSMVVTDADTLSKRLVERVQSAAGERKAGDNYPMAEKDLIIEKK